MNQVEVVEQDPPTIENLSISPDTRATLLISLTGEITVTGVVEGEHDLSLLFLAFQPPTIAALQHLLLTLVDVSASLSDDQTFLRLASASERTRSEANKTRVVAAIDARGVDFIRGLERYRLTADLIVEDDQKLMLEAIVFSTLSSSLPL